MRTRQQRKLNDSSSSDEEDVLMVEDESSDEEDNIIKDEEEEENSIQIVLESPTSFEHIPIIKLDHDYFLTAIYIKKFLHQGDYDLVKAFKKFGQEKDRKVLFGSDMQKLVQLSQHQFLSSDLEIKPNIKGIVLFRVEWIIEMFNREVLSSNEITVEQVDITDFSILFDLDRNCVDFKEQVLETIVQAQNQQQEDKIKEEEDSKPMEEVEETFHTCPVRTRGIEKFQDFLQANISHNSSNQQQLVIVPFDY